VRRTVRHVEPWSVLKLSLLFFAAVFLIVCVASAVLWSGARASGQLDHLESFITSVGGFGNCDPIDGAALGPDSSTTTTEISGDANQINPGTDDTGSTDVTDEVTTTTVAPSLDEDADCPPGYELVGAFKFEDVRIFEAFAFGGVVLILAGTGAAVVLALLFNLMSDLTGGVQITVIEEDGGPRRQPGSGSPPSHRRG
jgi:hypothetical protein